MTTPAFRSRYVLALLAVFLAASARSAVGAHYPADWIVENLLVVALLIPLIIWRKQTLAMFSLTSWTLMCVFFCIHQLGAHWTYSEVPYREWWAALTGSPVPADGIWPGRNHFDRLVHFSYGLVFLLPIRELLTATSPLTRGFWSHFIPLSLIMATSMVYELIEWGAAVILGGDLALAYNGSQGDVWDPQKDMALATLGGLIVTLVILIANRRNQSAKN